MAKHNYCTRCTHHTDCGFISRGLENKCVILDIFDAGVDAGVDAAIDKASQWLQENLDDYLDVGVTFLVSDFKKAMQNE